MGSMAQGPGWTFFLLLRCCVILDIYFTLPEPQFSVNGHSRAVLGFNLVTCQGPFPCWHSVDTRGWLVRVSELPAAHLEGLHHLL